MGESEVKFITDTRCEVIGNMIFNTVPTLLDQSMKRIRASGSDLVVDLDKVSHADSAGLALMLEWLRLAKAASKKLSFVNIPPQLLNLTEITGLNHIIVMTVE